MLQRAASNAYSWWWASHIRTKQSKWLEDNLQDMDERVASMLKLIENKGDSFAQRVEMYYKKRPELIGQVEEAYRSYRALAERYDHLSKDMQSANRTIAAVFPEQIQYAIDDDYYEGHNSAASASPEDANKSSNANIPKVPTTPIKDFRSQSMFFSRKEQSLGKIASAAAPPDSGLTREEATEEIDKIQKDILALQTEREFIQSIYERCSAKCNGIDSQITDMQARVNSLEDEYGIVKALDDNEARTLMAATALKSCKDTLVKLQEKQELSAEEVKMENRRVKDLIDKFTNIRSEFQYDRTGLRVPYDEQEAESEDLDRLDRELLRQKLKKELQAEGNSSFTVMQLAEKIDDLVETVIRLETEVSSQNALVTVLRSEADGFQERIKTLETEKEVLMENTETMSNKIKELEEELQRVKSLNQSVKEKTDNLQVDVAQATCNIDHLSEKLKNVKPSEDFHDVQETEASTDAGTDYDKRDDASAVSNSSEDKRSDSQLRQMPQGTSTVLDNMLDEVGTDAEEEDQPNWSNLLAGGLVDREKHLVQEYILVLRNYKEVKKRLGDVEKKNRDGFFELALQIRELKNAIAIRDDEIHVLRKTNSIRKSEDENRPRSPESMIQAPSIPDTNHSTISSPQRMYDSEHEHHVELMSQASAEEDIKLSTPNEIRNVNSLQVTSAMEEKLRSEIDSLLEENLEFWLRFSSSFHQIQKYQNSIQDLKAELSKLEESSKGQCIMSEARPIYRHLKEIQTELTLWLETNSVLKDELQSRCAALSSIQEELAKGEEEAQLNQYQAAKFQGEILNMKQESSKVSNELQAGWERVNVLRDDIEKILLKMDEELGLSATKQRTHRARIPLRSFLFGVKLKKHRRSSSLFSCTTPTFLEHDGEPGSPSDFSH
ncbi:protein NETWORKED 2A [Mercurialis annua]|uniref:protein NETWORKED 2A n=1 Tax=Mercurialis annua TaxID=3986 RepID=UPI00215FBD17|nr:protein NETWORKED 2A [Mercurialis annua]